MSDRPLAPPIALRVSSSRTLTTSETYHRLQSFLDTSSSRSNGSGAGAGNGATTAQAIQLARLAGWLGVASGELSPQVMEQEEKTRKLQEKRERKEKRKREEEERRLVDDDVDDHQDSQAASQGKHVVFGEDEAEESDDVDDEIEGAGLPDTARDDVSDGSGGGGSSSDDDDDDSKARGIKDEEEDVSME